MESPRKDILSHTPTRFLTVRGKRTTTSTVASSHDGSPRFASCRQAGTPSRPSVLLVRSELSIDAADFKPGESWPVFPPGAPLSLPVASHHAAGVRKRDRASEAQVRVPGPSAMLSLSLARRLRSEPGATANSVDSTSASPNALSPTASDWLPRRTPLSPQASSLSYADVARIGDGRPPPPFPLLGCGQHSVPSIRAPPAGATGGFRWPEDNRKSTDEDGMDGDKETGQTRGLCRGMSGVLGKPWVSSRLTALHRSSTDQSTDVNPVVVIAGESSGAGVVDEVTPPREDDKQYGASAAAGDADAGCPEAAFGIMYANTSIAGFGNSPFLPQTVTEYRAFQADLTVEHKKKQRRRAHILAQELKSAIQVALSDTVPLRLPHLHTDGLSCVLAKQTCFIETQPSRQPEQSEQQETRTVPWPTNVNLWTDSVQSSRCLPLPSYGHTVTTIDDEWAGSHQGCEDRDITLSNDRLKAMNAVPWDWLSSKEAMSIRRIEPSSVDMDDVSWMLQGLIDHIDNPETWM